MKAVSTLARLLVAHAEMFQPPRVKHTPKGDVTQPLIVAVSLDEEGPEPLSREELESWRQELKKLLRPRKNPRSPENPRPQPGAARFGRQAIQQFPERTLA
jgi:hypothetical protein